MKWISSFKATRQFCSKPCCPVLGRLCNVTLCGVCVNATQLPVSNEDCYSHQQLWFFSQILWFCFLSYLWSYNGPKSRGIWEIDWRPWHKFQIIILGELSRRIHYQLFGPQRQLSVSKTTNHDCVHKNLQGVVKSFSSPHPQIHTHSWRLQKNLDTILYYKEKRRPSLSEQCVLQAFGLPFLCRHTELSPSK